MQGEIFPHLITSPPTTPLPSARVLPQATSASPAQAVVPLDGILLRGNHLELHPDLVRGAELRRTRVDLPQVDEHGNVDDGHVRPGRDL